MSHRSTPERIALGAQWLHYYPQFIEPDQADALLHWLRDNLAWEQSRIKVYGREHPIPRLNAWLGEPGLSYRYSGVTFQARHWPQRLASLATEIGQCTGQCFNSVLANYYRDGRDCMGWHSDDEPELGPAPCVAALSLGAVRSLKFRPRQGGGATGLALGHGSLLVMAPGVQRHWQHSLPRRAGVGPRLSLTFRFILQ